jgi:hypothetical protein
VRKQSSPNLDSALERIPEYSEDIYPYATFHLKDQDKGSSNRQTPGMIYESRDAMHISKKHRSSSGGGMNASGTGQRSRKKSKKFNTESEEYDSLNSDSDTVSRELDATSRTESSNCLDDTGPVNFSSKNIKKLFDFQYNISPKFSLFLLAISVVFIFRVTKVVPLSARGHEKSA